MEFIHATGDHAHLAGVKVLHSAGDLLPVMQDVLHAVYGTVTILCHEEHLHDHERHPDYLYTFSTEDGRTLVAAVSSTPTLLPKRDDYHTVPTPACDAFMGAIVVRPLGNQQTSYLRFSLGPNFHWDGTRLHLLRGLAHPRLPV